MKPPRDKKQATRSSGTARPSPEKPDARAERFRQISKSGSQIVRDAAVLLDEEIAAGIVAAKQMQQRFQKERRVDPADFKALIQKFQGDAHEVVNLFSDQLSQLRSAENAELVNNLVRRSHDILDLATEVVVMSAEIASQTVQARVRKTRSAGDARGKS